MQSAIMAVILFIILYGLIISEKVNKVAIAIFGASMAIIIGFLTFNDAIHHIEFNTLGVLIGMMLIVGIIRRTGVFEYLAIKSAKLAKGDPWKILVVLGLITAIASTILPNVTVILLIIPVTLVITSTLKIDPKPLLIVQMLMANIGGALTIIGDPPNIMIGSASNLTFIEFVKVLFIPIALSTVAIFIIFYFIYRKKLIASPETKEEILQLNARKAIKDKKLLIKCGVILLITIISFIAFPSIPISVISLLGASILIIITASDVEEVFQSVEWTTLAFFTGLFVMVGMLVEVGVIDNLADLIVDFTGGDLLLTTLLILWVAGIASGFLDNIPFVATMIPLILTIEQNTDLNVYPLWWALSLGACLGGNGSLIGSSSNIIVSGVMEKQGHKIRFVEYLKIGFPLTVITLIISTIYLYVVFFLI